MFRRIYRQRRRLALSAFFFSLAIFATLSRHSNEIVGEMDAVWWGPPLILGLTSIVLGLIYAAIGSAIIVLIPDWRGIIEMVALTLFADAMLAYAFPGYFGIDNTSGYSAATWFALYYLIWSVVFGSRLDRFRFCLGYKAERRFTSRMSPADLWRTMVLGEAPVAQHYDPLLAEATQDPDDPQTYAVTYKHGQSIFQHQTITYLERKPNECFRYRYYGNADPSNRSLTEGTFGASFEALPQGGTRVTLSAERPSMLPRLAIALWLDDDLGDTCDSLAARHKNRRDWSLFGLYRRKVAKLA